MNHLIQSISFATLMATTIPLAASAMPNFIAQGLSNTFERQQPQRRRPIKRPNKVLGQPCPEGQILIMWDKPIYDEQGLFVVGHEKVPVCIPENTEPAG